MNDPSAAISALAAVTTNVSFGITAARTFEQPCILAHRLSTVDRLTKGRVAWNVVSSYLNSVALNIGVDKQTGHDKRHDMADKYMADEYMADEYMADEYMADEYMDVVYKLWEGSWEVQAGQVHLRADRERVDFRGRHGCSHLRRKDGLAPANSALTCDHVA